MAISSKWTNGSDNTTNNTGLTLVVGTTGAITTNGAIAIGDLLLIFVYAAWGAPTSNAAVPSISDGTYTSIYSHADTTAGNSIASWYKIATATTASTPTITFANAPIGASWAMNAWSSALDSAPDAADGNATVGYSASTTAPSISPTGVADMLICAWGTQGGDPPYAPPGAMTTLYELGSTSSGRPELVVSYLQLSASGATGTQVLTAPLHQGNMGISAAFFPAVAATAWRGFMAMPITF